MCLTLKDAITALTVRVWVIKLYRSLLGKQVKLLPLTIQIDEILLMSVSCIKSRYSFLTFCCMIQSGLSCKYNN